ncbi:uncharacterized protein LOC131052778 isoform X2 [Cryptomeria japonica]|uniref:uncharacterized protein LOC131052778 isoform X2 n=1 Tax=Cryptomeria japonica TaxID=3369 RepID=UPI0025AC8B38|nr:uncharacterized protein LOC131052778 isoform X2 [Cryptomeria japonica]XP_057843373.1 uncharacterized protein LOC131052778 isoform X2 [Cryptomeria japonica]XP_057843374.1 uncharacterized protein LOC131052778 isoform X2 [Cryptomeria japonica]XP_057843375.1 uncharacterized protein LOC131052778 isoform X2 [Cryptomeria japonica]
MLMAAVIAHLRYMVLKMNETSQEAHIGSTSLAPPKRKRGRPRKTHLLCSGGETSVQQQLEIKKKAKRKKLDASLSSFAENTFVGQEVHGMLDGSFDAGYLLTVRVGDTDTVLRGVVFEPGLSVPVSQANDIAPNVKMTRRDENTVAISSTSVPFLTAPVLNSPGTTSVSIPQQTRPPVAVGAEQLGVVSLQPNGSPLNSVLQSHANQDSAPKLPEPVSQLQQFIPCSVKSVTYLPQPVPSPSDPACHLQKSIQIPVAPVPQQNKATLFPAEPSSHQSKPILPPCAETTSQPQQPIADPPEPVGLQMNVKENQPHT